VTGDGLLFGFEASILAYFVGINAAYLAQNLLALRGIRAYVQRWGGEARPWIHTGFEPPISVIVPMHDEEATAATSVRSFLQLEYPEFEVVVVNDGSKDRTLEVLVEAFDLRPFPEASHDRVPTRPVRGVFRSARYPNLRVVDKENGRKADALNAGLNRAVHPLALMVDGDSFLQRDSLLRVVQPFLEDPTTVACGGTVRIANGCTATGGFLTDIALPRSTLAKFQIVEYMRAFLFGRMGWAPLNALCIISGAFGLFHRETVLAAGGLRADALGEDMELTVRLHRRLRLEEPRPYRITFLPDPICWTEAPEDLGTLGRQRARWQHGLSEALWWHRKLFFHPRAGAVGWLALPFFAVFEWTSAAVEVLGYAALLAFLVAGILSLEGYLAFMGVAVGTGVVLSTSALLLEEMSFHVYPRRRDLGVLLLHAVLENFGYRQINAFWRFHGMVRFLLRRKSVWGAMPRTATWAK
jgi:cellulose synthase/poly-beta-1,6-N-acetylglucosamine synthase-like glycosyltransferase